MSLPVMAKTNAQNIFRAYANRIRALEKKAITAVDYLPDPREIAEDTTVLYVGIDLLLAAGHVYHVVFLPNGCIQYEEYYTLPVSVLPDIQDASWNAIYVLESRDDNDMYYVLNYDYGDQGREWVEITEDLVEVEWLPQDVAYDNKYCIFLPEIWEDDLELIVGILYYSCDGVWYPLINVGGETESFHIEIIGAFPNEPPETSGLYYYRGDYYEENAWSIPIHTDCYYQLDSRSNWTMVGNIIELEDPSEASELDPNDIGRYQNRYYKAIPAPSPKGAKDGSLNESYIDITNSTYEYRYALPSRAGMWGTDKYIVVTRDGGLVPGYQTVNTFYYYDLMQDAFFGELFQPRIQYDYTPNPGNFPEGTVIQYTGDDSISMVTGHFYRRNNNGQWDDITSGGGGSGEASVVDFVPDISSYKGQDGDVIRLSANPSQHSDVLISSDMIYYKISGRRLFNEGYYIGKMHYPLPDPSEYKSGGAILIEDSNLGNTFYVTNGSNWIEMEVLDNFYLDSCWPDLDDGVIDLGENYIIVSEGNSDAYDLGMYTSFDQSGITTSLYLVPGAEFMYSEQKDGYSWTQLTVPNSPSRGYYFNNKWLTTTQEVINEMMRVMESLGDGENTSFGGGGAPA